jgi:hypothetical protein
VIFGFFARRLHRRIRDRVEELLETCRGIAMREPQLKSTVFAFALVVRPILVAERVDLEIAQPDSMWASVD